MYTQNDKTLKLSQLVKCLYNFMEIWQYYTKILGIKRTGPRVLKS